MATKASENLGWIDKHTTTRIKKLIKKVGLPEKIDFKYDIEKFIKIMLLDKKNVNGEINLILIKELGKALKVSNAPREIISQVINNH